jgi:phenylacetate-coenzyme A ligase PaaK-like adenylate-forming protein
MGDVFQFLLQSLRLTLLARRGRDEILAVQQARWQEMLRHAAENSPFYRERLRGLDPRQARPVDVLPLTKAEMMAHFDDLVTDRRVRLADLRRFMDDPANLGKLYRGRYALCHTSGSQGQPTVVVQEKADLLLGFTAQAARGQVRRSIPGTLVEHLVRPARLAVVTQQPGFYPSGALFSYVRAMKLPLFRLLHLSVFNPMADIVARLNEYQPNYLAAYTYALEALAREEEAGRLRLRRGGRLRQLTNLSEPLPEPTREDIERTFGVHISDNYAMAECMALASGCPCGSGSHVNADLALLEVVDDRYQPVPDGTPGTRVLVTNLYNRVQPLIRYEIGDVVTLSPEPCPCGSPFPHVRSVGGRTKERFWIDIDGHVREIPYFVFLAGLHHCAELAEHQVLQTGRNRFAIRAAPQPGKAVSAEEVDRLVRRSLEAEGLARLLQWEVEIVDEIPPDPGSGKVQRARNLIGPPPATPEVRTAGDVVAQA